MDEIEVTQSNTGTYTVSFECPDGEELSKTNARLLFEESTISEVIDDLNMHRGDHALLARIAELEAECDRLRKVAEKLVWLYSDEYSEKRNNGLRIDGFYSYEWLDMILNMAREALKGAGE